VVRNEKIAGSIQCHACSQAKVKLPVFTTEALAAAGCYFYDVAAFVVRDVHVAGPVQRDLKGERSDHARPVLITLAVPGERIARGASAVPYKGTLIIGTGGVALLKSTTSPRRNPGTVGRNCTFTLQDMTLLIPATHVVPAVTTVKSRLEVPRVKGLHAAEVLAAPTENGNVRVVPVTAPFCRCPKPTVVGCASTIRLLLASTI
jgi:hypothetical protein